MAIPEKLYQYSVFTAEETRNNPLVIPCLAEKR